VVPVAVVVLLSVPVSTFPSIVMFTSGSTTTPSEEVVVPVTASFVVLSAT